MKKLILLAAVAAGLATFGMSGTAQAAHRGFYAPGVVYGGPGVYHGRGMYHAPVYGPAVAGSDVRIRARATPAGRNRVRATVRTPGRSQRIRIRTPNARIRVR
jgi:hypothetical protein